MRTKFNRRELLSAGGFLFLSGSRALGQGPDILFSAAESQSSPSPSARLLEALQRNRLPLAMQDGPSGSGWEWLLAQASGARFTLVGEEHGVAETAQLASSLFKALRGSGYARVAVELSPPIAQGVEAAARRSGLEGVTGFMTNPDVFTFCNLREEAQFLADVVMAGPKGERVLWGLDREIFSDRYLISRLEAKVPQKARQALARLKEASSRAKARFEQTRSGDDLFLLSGDPALVSELRAVWPEPDKVSKSVMRTLEASLSIEAAERTGGMWPYMQRRTQWMRDNLAAMLNEDMGRSPVKTLMKLGYNHTIRGANYINFFDMGSMVDEVAALTGDRAFHVLVIPSPGSRQAVIGAGRSFSSVLTDDFDDFNAGDGRLTRVLPNASATGHEVIDLRAVRPLALRGLESWNSDLVRTIHGYDAAVIWKEAHASSGLEANSAK